MIKLFIVEEYYIIFIRDISQIKIFCTDFKKFWSHSVDNNIFSISEIFNHSNLHNDEIDVKIQEKDDLLHVNVLKLKTDTIKIKLGHFQLSFDNDKNVLKIMMELIFKEMDSLSEKLYCRDILFERLQKENEQLGKDYKTLSENTLTREDQLLNKMCFLLNEKKRKIKELESEILETPPKTSKIQKEIKPNEGTKSPLKTCYYTTTTEEETIIDLDTDDEFEKSPDCQSNVQDDVIAVDSVNEAAVKNLPVPFSDNSGTSGDNTEDELFPESINPKFTAVPIKVHSKEIFHEINETKKNETARYSNANEIRPTSTNQQLNTSNEESLCNDLFNQM